MGRGLPPEGLGVLKSGCLGLTILLLLSDVLCSLVFFFFFLNWGQGWGGVQGKDLGKGCCQAWEQSGEPLSAMGLAQSPRASF